MLLLQILYKYGRTIDYFVLERQSSLSANKLKLDIATLTFDC